MDATRLPEDDPLCLGIDTGGTYTDAVLWSETAGVVAKSKALTTRHDLSVGIGGSVDNILAASGAPAAAIKLVSVSTTLATNALVEGQGGRAALVMIGFEPKDLARDGLGQALGTDPVVFCPGGHDVHGNPAHLDLSELEAQLPALSEQVEAFAVAAYFAVRNPEHEHAARRLIAEHTELPVTTSHELSTRLGGPRRALTTLLNGRLIALIERLLAATEATLSSRGIDAPLMVVRGDGALVSAQFAHRRPIETILSGPAASLVGARYLTGLDEAIVSDIGGTTTDVGVLDRGRPRLDPEGATVGGFRTMVEAVAMRSFGLGGDSEVNLDEGEGDQRVRLGPRRLIPLALACHTYGAAIWDALERQVKAERPSRSSGRFALRSGLPDSLIAGLSAAESRLLESVGAQPVPLDRLTITTASSIALNRLVARGLVHIAGFTPSDAAHVVGLQDNWNGNAARMGAELMARRPDRRGRPFEGGGRAFSEHVLALLTRRSAEVVLETAFAEDGLDGPGTVAHRLVQNAIDGGKSIARLAVSLDRPVIGLGASAALHYAALGPMVASRCLVPPDADVANAVGAVVGRVRVSAQARVSQPMDGVFRLAVGAGFADFESEQEAMEEARLRTREIAAERARAAGADNVEIEIACHMNTATVEARRLFIEARVVATATGRPKVAA